MKLRKLFRLFGPGTFGTALRLHRHRVAARRLLDGDASASPCRTTAEPYDALLVANLRKLLRLVRRVPVCGRRLASLTIAAAGHECAGRGWPCQLSPGTLDLWGVRVLQAGKPQGAALSLGPDVPTVTPRWPLNQDPTVSRLSTAEPLSASLADLLAPLGAIVPSGASVLIKPNLNSYHPPPASTSIDLLQALVDQLRELGVTRLALGECSGIALGRTRGVFARYGLLEWARTNDVEIRLFDEEPWHACPVSGARFGQIVVPACLPEYDRLIYVGPAKTHHMAGVSLGLKMTIGLMHPVQRLELHHDHLTERLADAALAVRPDLAILDARQCFITGGPAHGTVAQPGLLLASRQLEALEEAGLQVLAEHGAVGLERGREQLAAARMLRFGEAEGVPEAGGE